LTEGRPPHCRQVRLQGPLAWILQPDRGSRSGTIDLQRSAFHSIPRREHSYDTTPPTADGEGRAQPLPAPQSTYVQRFMQLLAALPTGLYPPQFTARPNGNVSQAVAKSKVVS